MDPLPIEITTLKFNIPAVEHEVLSLTVGGEKSSSSYGMVKSVDVTAAGVLVEFLKGGKHCSPCLFVTTRAEQPKPKQPKPKPQIVLKPTDDTTEPAANRDGGTGSVEPSGQEPAIVQPLVSTPQGDGTTVSGEVRLEVPSMGEGDLGLESGVQRHVEVSPSGTDGSGDQSSPVHD